MKAADRVVFNTGVLYAQLIIGMLLGLFTTRIVLDALGETNYGIYMLVAGVVGMLGILSTNMSGTSLRFMAISIGSGDHEKARKTFNSTLFLHFIIGAAVILVMEAGGWLMFEYFLNIPTDRVYDAKVVFHFMVITIFVAVISVPYDAVMNAHENLLALALVEIFGHVLRLGVAVYILYSDANVLILYGFLIFLIQLILRVIKQWYSKVKYDECKIRFRDYVDKSVIKSILAYTGWNVFGSLGSLAITQIRGVILNMFFGVSLNAAQGISQKASSQVNMVSVSLTRAINPQLIKSEGGGNRSRMLHITEISTKYSLFLFALFALPVFIEADYLLNLWLKEVPEFTIIFVQLTLLAIFIEKLTFQITHAIKAVGVIRNFQIAETSFILLNIPLTYLVFKLGYSPVATYLVGILVSLLLSGVRFFYGKKVANLYIGSYLRNAVVPILIPMTLAVIITLPVYLFMSENILRFIMVLIINLVIISISFWMFSLNNDEKSKFKIILTKVLNQKNLLKFK